MKDIVEFRGVKEGIFIDIHTSDFEEAKKVLIEKMEKNHTFYKDIQLIDIFAEELSDREIVELKLILRYKYDIIILDGDLPEETFFNKSKIKREELEEKHTEEDIAEKETPEKEVEPLKYFKGIDVGITKFIYGTLRSGQEIYFDGNIIIVGDVNPGCYVFCTGNLIVMGNFRGVCHVGCDGNDQALLACYNLQPIQVRIADHIAISPDNEFEASKMPEIVRIKEGEVVVEQYLPNKQGGRNGK